MTYQRFGTQPREHAPAALVRAELDRILASELFARSARLSSFLRFIVERTLAGDGDSLKEHVIAVELYGKPLDFNTADDPIVRIDARRLRDRLREYYAGAADAAVIISVPKGSYTPVFQTTAAAVADADIAVPVSPATHGSRRWTIAAAGGVVLIVAATWVVGARIGGPIEPERLLTVTSLPGNEEDPSLSPDGRFVAFSWRGLPANADSDIWIKSVDGEAMRNLTNTPDASEQWARWSPDGQWIAFSRRLKGGSVVIKVSALGGPEQTIADSATDASWTPDSRGLVMRATAPDRRGTLVYQLLETGVRHQLTETPAGFFDVHPRVSPDGTRLAFIRSGEGRSGVFLLPMSGGEPTLLGEWSNGAVIGGLEWMPDGRELLVAKPAPDIRRLIRVPAGARAPEVPVPSLPHESVGPSLARVGSRYRLAVASGQPDVGLRLVDLESSNEGGAITDASFCDATRMDVPGRFSPEGEKVAFASDRGGSQQIWVANRDGSALRALTQLKDASVSLGSWSPDGRSVAFNAAIGDRPSIYVVPVDGGPLTRLTDGTMSAIDPEWSRDGRWIYFSSNRSGDAAIWKIGAAGGNLTQVTTEVGYDPRESPDGRSLYFVSRPRFYGLGAGSRLKRVSVDGGPVEVLDVQVAAGGWDVTDAGVVFLAQRAGDAQGATNLQVYDFTTRRIRTIGQLAFVVGPHGSPRFLTVSRDGRWALASHVDRWERDIFVVDGFR